MYSKFHLSTDSFTNTLKEKRRGGIGTTFDTVTLIDNSRELIEVICKMIDLGCHKYNQN